MIHTLSMFRARTDGRFTSPDPKVFEKLAKDEQDSAGNLRNQ